MRNFDKVTTTPDRAIASYQIHVNHTCLHVALSLPNGLKSFRSRAFRVSGDASWAGFQTLRGVSPERSRKAQNDVGLRRDCPTAETSKCFDACNMLGYNGGLGTGELRCTTMINCRPTALQMTRWK